MSATINGGLQLSTKNAPLAVNQFSFAFKVRYENNGILDNSLNNQTLIAKGGSAYVNFAAYNGVDNLQLLITFTNTLMQRSYVKITINTGTPYCFLVTYDQGKQVCIMNGIPKQFGNMIGQLLTTPWPFVIGGNMPPYSNNLAYTIDQPLFWENYVGTLDDAIALRDGTIDPKLIGQSASVRIGYNLIDSGMSNIFGDPAYDLVSKVGTGKLTYTSALQFEPSVICNCNVTGCGELIGMEFNNINNGAIVSPIELVTPPSLILNHVNVGPLQYPWNTKKHNRITYAVPKNVRIKQSDIVSLLSPLGWANTPDGPVHALKDVIENNAEKSLVKTKTMKPGANMAHLGTHASAVYSLTKNWRFRCDELMGAKTFDKNGKPLTGLTEIKSYFYAIPPISLDTTLILPVGYWATGIDSQNGTTNEIITYSDKILKITEMLDGYNPGINGVGQVRVWKVEALSTVALPIAYNNVVYLLYKLKNSTGVYQFDNDVIYGPGDFTYTPGVPTVLDKSDPYEISNICKNRFKYGSGSFRFADSNWPYGGIGYARTKKDVHRLTDYSWGNWAGNSSNTVLCKQLRPWNQDGYLYTTYFGDPYPVTLNKDIDETSTILEVSGDTVITGQHVVVDNEDMLVTNVDIINSTLKLTVERNNPSPHSKGVIKVRNRALAKNVQNTRGQVLEAVFDTPHNLGCNRYHGYGNWPIVTYNDKTTSLGGFPLNYQYMFFMPTGSNTGIIIMQDSRQVPYTTIPSPINLDSTCIIKTSSPETPSVPIEFSAKFCEYFKADYHFNLVHGYDDTLAEAAFQWIKDNTTPGRNVFCEYTNEPWNGRFWNAWWLEVLSMWVHPELKSTFGVEFYIEQGAHAKNIAERVFGDRKNEIKWLINSNKHNWGGLMYQLELAKNLATPIDLVAIATYVSFDTSSETQKAFWNYNDRQACDLFVYQLYYDPIGYPYMFDSFNKVIATYNTKYGENVQLYAYEGGLVCAAPVWSTNLTSDIDNITQQIKVTTTDGLINNIPLLIENEWVSIAEIIDVNTLTVLRGQYETLTAVHKKGNIVKTAYEQRSHDIAYNPYWLNAEWAVIYMVQQGNFLRFNIYAHAIGQAEPTTWYGIFHQPWQDYGVGNGSDGKADNSLCMIRPDSANYKLPGTSQEMYCVSVRGYAFNKWMEEFIVYRFVDPIDWQINNTQKPPGNMPENINAIWIDNSGINRQGRLNVLTSSDPLNGEIPWKNIIKYTKV